MVGRVALAALILGIGVGPPVASAASAPPRSFTVTALESAGSTPAVYKETLSSGGKHVGRDRTVCQLGKVTVCQTTFFFSGGTIKTRTHPAISATKFKLSLNSGTGRFSGHPGTVSVRVLSRNSERETFKFS